MQRPLLRIFFPGMAVFGALLCGSGALTRLSDRGYVVPESLRTFDLGGASERQNATLALQAGNPGRAEMFAKQAIARDPMRQTGVALLGLAQLHRGAEEEANATFRVAAALGWRDPITQLYWANAAIASGDEDLGAQRIDAVLRTGKAQGAATPILQQLEASPTGRLAVAKRLALIPTWTGSYVAAISSLPDPEAIRARIATLSLARSTGLVPDCPGIAGAARSLASGKRYREAADLWFSVCSPKGDVEGSLIDGEFERARYSASPSPFEWKLEASGAIEVLVEAPPTPMSGKALGFRTTGSSREAVARQLILLKPGSYRVSWRSLPAGTARTSPALFGVTCAGSGKAISSPSIVGEGAARHAVDFDVPVEGCPAQSVSILAEPPQGADGGMVYVDGVTIEPRS